MAFHYTDDQLKVIQLHNRDLLVSAAAGSGKTAVLVERIIRMLEREENPIDVDRLLIVTFTKAAAAEMRERIGVAIAKRVAENPDNKHLRRQEALLHNAQITTIDSFCTFVLRNNFNDIGLDPDFRAIEDGEKSLMLHDCMEEVLENFYAEGNESFYRTVDAYCPDGNEQKLESLISQLYIYSQSYPFPEEWLKSCVEAYRVESAEALQNTKWMQDMLGYVHRLLQWAVKSEREAIPLAQTGYGVEKYVPVMQHDLEQLEALCECETYAEIKRRLEMLEWDKAPSIRTDSCDFELKEKLKNLRAGIKEALGDMHGSYFADSLETVFTDMEICKEQVETLVALALALGELYAERKKKRKLIDFSDMEHYALQILIKRDEEGNVVPTETAREYQDYFEEIMVDEYQDSNLVQELLLTAVSREARNTPNMFMVGDVKQSIYQFRLARPEIFMGKYDTYEEAGALEAEMSGGHALQQKIELSRNFRSRREVLDSVNDVCCRIMTKEVGNVEYNERVALYYGANYPEAETEDLYKTELCLIDSGDAKGEEKKRLEAEYIALRIKQMVGSFTVCNKDGSTRKARYGDMAILLRSGKGLADSFHQVLEQNGIPSHVQSSGGYYDAPEIRTLLNMIEVLNNPYQDIPLYGVMNSVFGNFTNEEIAILRARRKEHLYVTLREVAEKGIDEELSADSELKDLVDITSIKNKAARLLELIDRYRDMAVYQPIHELIRILVRESHYMDSLSVQNLGDQAIANVEMLIEQAVQFDSSSYHGLFRFVQYIKQLIKYEVDTGEASILDENADVVHIITIHKSKGLEYPVCFLANVNHTFQLKDSGDGVLMDIDMGIATKMVDVERRLTADTVFRRFLCRKMNESAIGEELRILYVAMTRAREKLIMTGVASPKDSEKVETIREKQQLGEETRPADYVTVAGMRSFKAILLDALENGCRSIEYSVCDAEQLLDMQVRQEMKELTAEQLIAELHDRATEGEVADPELYHRLKDNLARVYAHPELTGLYSKTSVSELKMAHIRELEEASENAFETQLFEDASTQEPVEEEAFEPAKSAKPVEVVEAFEEYVPAFLRTEETVEGTTRGTAYHRVLELLDLTRVGSIDEIRDQMMEMVEKDQIDASACELVSPWKIKKFTESKLAKRMAEASARGQLYKEQPFVLGLPANEVRSEFPEEELLLIQGIIDVYFVEENGIVLADYKTDRIDTKEHLTNKYKVQIDYYTRALEQLTGKPVKERILYSLYFGEEVPC